MNSKKFFDVLFNDVHDSFNSFYDIAKAIFEESCNENEKDKDEKSSTYYHFLSDKYENGKCVDHREKIIDNGKVIKDEYKAIENKKEETPTIGSEVLKTKTDEINNLKSENEKLTKENEILKSKLSQIKNMFN